MSEAVLDDLGDLLPAPAGVATAAAKAWRYVDEMREIAATQAAAGLPGALFEGMAQAYEELARRSAGRSLDDVTGDASWEQVLGDLR